MGRQKRAKQFNGRELLLAIDIGNTSISLGVIKNGKICQKHQLNRCSLRNYRNLFKQLCGRIKKKYPLLEDVVICSVVPKLTVMVVQVIKGNCCLSPKIIGKHIKVPIKNKYRVPSQVGQDRLVCAFAARELYGSPVLIIDLGTAITFDVVSAKGNYEGGMIVPGIQLSAESLFKKTALLPKIHMIQAPRSLVGKNTKDSILSGIFHGYGAMCDGLIEKISAQLKGRPKVILTGGYVNVMNKYIKRNITKIDQNLVFKGISLLNK